MPGCSKNSKEANVGRAEVREGESQSQRDVCMCVCSVCWGAGWVGPCRLLC